MPKCKHHEVCGLDADADGEFCILHSQVPGKDRDAFERALAAHREKDGNNFQHFVFPGPANFRGETFHEEANFSEAHFTEGADFFDACFANGADFEETNFSEGAEFRRASFGGLAYFAAAEFTKSANFSCAAFAEEANFCAATFIRGANFTLAGFGNVANFSRAKFNDAAEGADSFCAGSVIDGEKVIFQYAKFSKWANFDDAKFGGGANFSRASFKEGATFSGACFATSAAFVGTAFLGTTLFASEDEINPIFSGADIDFSQVIISPLDAVIFRSADLQKCRFLFTDMRKAEFTDVKWPCKGGRFRVHDEDVGLRKGETRSWPVIEHLYRQLKQNYEDRRDYEHARHFHYGEKEMRRRNSGWGLWILLSVYRCVSGYGESALCPFLWAAGLLLASTCCYLNWSLLHLNTKGPIADPVLHWYSVGLYSLRVMTLLRPSDFIPNGFCGNLVNMLQSIFGPLLFALFALALRQRLKR